MPIELHNNFTGSKTDPLTLRALMSLQQTGYSVMKTPHVGNQHPSNLLCAALGFHMNMVTFTSGERDKNFHPHMQIKNQVSQPLFSPNTWTPFAKISTGESAENYHQRSVTALFPDTTVTADVALMQADTNLALRCMRLASTVCDNVWYRAVTKTGVVHHVSQPSWDTLAATIFRVTDAAQGYLVPNVLSILYDVIWQSLSSGRDSVYALSGPDAIGYIGGTQKRLTSMYDAIRCEIPALPAVLKVYVVPVAQCRFLTHCNRQDSLDELVNIVLWYESRAPEQRQSAKTEVIRVGTKHPEFGRWIGHADYMSQYDLSAATDLYFPEWLLETPLSRVRFFYQLLAEDITKVQQRVA